MARRKRFIPAGAGNSRRTRERIPAGTVHPRGCGEQQYNAAVDLRNAGSSPRVRGTGWTLVG